MRTLLLAAVPCLGLLAACAKDAAPAPAPTPVPAPAPAPTPALPPVDHVMVNGHPRDLATLKIGDPAPDFDLPGIDGRRHALADFKQAQVLMVMFTSNHCPTSHAVEKRLAQLRADMKGKSFALVAINPNHPDGLSIDELGYGRFTDSFADMKPYAESNGWDFPYLFDGDEQRTARAYGCLATPHVFVFDAERRLRYAGRFDDSHFADAATVKSPDARRAVEALLAGRPVPVALTRPHGCSTKWREKKPAAEAREAQFAGQPVEVATADLALVASLRANPTRKHRLINLWATWCAPCRAEFPDLVALSRRFDMREFELVTLSLDAPADLPKVKAFLEKQGAGVSAGRMASVRAEGRGTNHYVVEGADTDALAKALDPQWKGPVPYTLLVAPGGEILWRHDGPIDQAEACAEIIKAMKPYYTP